MKRKWVVIGSGFVVFLVALWLVVFFVRMNQLEDEIQQIYNGESQNIGVSEFSVIVEGMQYDIGSFEVLDEKPTVVDVRVTYEDGSEVIKPAYVVYDDIKSSEYVDGQYGKIILAR